MLRQGRACFFRGLWWRPTNPQGVPGRMTVSFLPRTDACGMRRERARLLEINTPIVQ